MVFLLSSNCRNKEIERREVKVVVPPATGAIAACVTTE
jgi:hypothetical protein